MRSNRLVIVGAGGHGVVAADCAEAAKVFHEVCFVDDRWPGHDEQDGWPVIGKTGDLERIRQPGDQIFVAIGDAVVREHLFVHMLAMPVRLATIVHPAAVVSAKAIIGRGCLVVAGAVVGPGAVLGDGVIVNTGATVDHHCHLGAFVHVCPGAHLGGNVQVGDRTWIGIGVSVKHSIMIGRDVVVGAGAAVVENVPDGVTVTGVPARARIDSSTD